MQTQFELFVQELDAQFPDARIQLDSFLSNTQTLTFIWRERLWVFDYVPSHAVFGVHEVGEEEFFTVGYDHTFGNFEDAQRKLLELVSVCRNEPMSLGK